VNSPSRCGKDVGARGSALYKVLALSLACDLAVKLINDEDKMEN